MTPSKPEPAREHAAPGGLQRKKSTVNTLARGLLRSLAGLLEAFVARERRHLGDVITKTGIVLSE